MFKKIGIGVLVLLLAGIGFVWFKFGMPMQARLDKVTPDTAARDYALQDESKVTLPCCFLVLALSVWWLIKRTDYLSLFVSWEGCQPCGVLNVG